MATPTKTPPVSKAQIEESWSVWVAFIHFSKIGFGIVCAALALLLFVYLS